MSPSDPAGSVQSSIYDGVVLNSCRDTSALTDFPLDPSRYGDYFGHKQQLQYMNEYAQHFGLKKHIRLSTRVLSSEPREDGSWAVRVQEEGKDSVEELTFDAVFVCVGHLSTPSIPEFKGRDAFRGQFLHSHYYRRPGPFDRKKVAIIGLGSSAVDIACEIAPGAEEVHVITRRGGWVLPRYVLGKPVEAFDSELTPRSSDPRVQSLPFRRSCNTGLVAARHSPVAADKASRSRRWEAARGHATVT